MILLKNVHMVFKSELTGEKQKVLNNINLNINYGDCLGILGESGSGKSTLGKILIGLLKPTKGTYIIDETIQPYRSKKERKVLGNKTGVVFQDYSTSVNPRFTVYEIIKESLVLLFKRTKSKINYNEEVQKYLNLVELNESFKDRYPHQLSGGQLQRVCIARAIALSPQVILFDEAISSLDAHTGVQIMNLLKKLREDLNLTYIFITHDITSITYMCNKVMFLYKGEVVEKLDVKDIGKTKDEYAQKLLNSVILV